MRLAKCMQLVITVLYLNFLKNIPQCIIYLCNASTFNIYSKNVRPTKLPLSVFILGIPTHCIFSHRNIRQLIKWQYMAFTPKSLYYTSVVLTLLLTTLTLFSFRCAEVEKIIFEKWSNYGAGVMKFKIYVPFTLKILKEFSL